MNSAICYYASAIPWLIAILRLALARSGEDSKRDEIFIKGSRHGLPLDSLFVV